MCGQEYNGACQPLGAMPYLAGPGNASHIIVVALTATPLKYRERGGMVRPDQSSLGFLLPGAATGSARLQNACHDVVRGRRVGVIDIIAT